MCLAGIIDITTKKMCIKFDLYMHAESAKEEPIEESQVSDDESAVSRPLLQEKNLKKLETVDDYTEVRE